ncbi:MAG: hypothetical protein EHM19_11865, partial [Candidatus Latescibacterota bacterium]
MKKIYSLFLAFLLPVSAGAVVLRVPGEHPTIQSAVDAAAPGDTVLIAPGTYTDSVVVAGKEALFLIGEEGRDKTFLDGNDKGIPLRVDHGLGPLFVSGLTMQRGFTYTNGGGMVVQKTPVRIVDCRFVANKAENSGGGLSLLNCPSVQVERCIFEGNFCIDEASAVSVVGGRGEFAENVIRGNFGSLAAVFMQSACRVRDNVIVQNECSAFGALAYQLALAAEIDGNTIAMNTGKEGMGALLIQMGRLKVERNLIAGNKGGAGINIHTEDSLVELAGNNLWENEGGAYLG